MMSVFLSLSLSLRKISKQTNKTNKHDFQGGAISEGLSTRLWVSQLTFLSLTFLVNIS